jgi:hypothetical protein
MAEERECRWGIKKKRERVVGGVGGEREANAWADGNLPRWNFAACVAGGPSHRDRLGLVGYSIGIVVTSIFLRTASVSNFSL